MALTLNFVDGMAFAPASFFLLGRGRFGMDAFSDVPVDAGCEAEFDRAFELLLKLVDLRRADEMMPLGSGAVYTASVVLWLLV